MRQRLWLPFLAALGSFQSLHAQQYDVLVYGATPAGIAAALAAASDGDKVLLVEPTNRIGGMVTNGLSHTDFRTFEALTGAYLKFAQRVEAHYRKDYGDKAGEVSFRGTHAEPKVNLLVFEQMLAEQPNITLQKQWELEGAKMSDGGPDSRTRTLGNVLFYKKPSGQRESVTASVYIDATYEGDLMAAARVPYRVGREGKAEFGESLAPETADTQLQGYNFRLCMTKDAANRVPAMKPEGYDRKDFTGVLALLESGKVNALFGMKPAQIFKSQTPPLPGGKFDVNDQSHGPVRLSMPGRNDAWPDGMAGPLIRGGISEAIQTPPFSRLALAQARAAIFQEHVRWNVGLLYFLQNDSAVPEKFRAQANEWGFCKDEFTETNHLPEQLYVREARRMEGQYVYTERDSEHAEGDARAVLRKDAIATGDYGPNCHGTAREGTLFQGKHTGEFYKHIPPYQIPYGVLVPKDVDNLLVAGAVSSSHVGFCSLRLEPIWMSLGQAAGHAAHLARRSSGGVQSVSASKLQTRLHSAGSATVYVSDVPPGHADFAMVQWWATAGGFHGLAPTPAAGALRGKQIVGQYFEAFPHHAAELDLVLDETLAQRWKALAAEMGVQGEVPRADGKTTRGAWLKAVWGMR
jgi:hypothetical protein